MVQDIFHRPAIEFVQPDREYATDGSGRTLVRIVPDTTLGLGVGVPQRRRPLRHLHSRRSTPRHRARRHRPRRGARRHRRDDVRRAVVGAAVGDWNQHLRVLQDAQEQQRKVKIVYSRAWSRTVTERIIEPLRLVQTQRGWEVDAGPVGPEGNLRTYLLSNIRSAEPLDETSSPRRAPSRCW